MENDNSKTQSPLEPLVAAASVAEAAPAQSVSSHNRKNRSRLPAKVISPQPIRPPAPGLDPAKLDIPTHPTETKEELDSKKEAEEKAALAERLDYETKSIINASGFLAKKGYVVISKANAEQINKHLEEQTLLMGKSFVLGAIAGVSTYKLVGFICSYMFSQSASVADAVDVNVEC